jgi:flavin reductase (DIM6/NTAB) family NADH-FMN oxidoreductase RutF
MKDTPANIVETGEFVYNLVTEALLKEVDRTSAPL